MKRLFNKYTKNSKVRQLISQIYGKFVISSFFLCLSYRYMYSISPTCFIYKKWHPIGGPNVVRSVHGPSPHEPNHNCWIDRFGPHIDQTTTGPVVVSHL